MRFRFLLVFALFACGAPPDVFSVDPDLGVRAEVVRDAVDAWCVAVGYCPTEQTWAGDAPGSIRLVDAVPPGRNGRPLVGKNLGDRIILDRGAAAETELDRLWVIIAHEIGHYCADHTKTGLMVDHDIGQAPEVDGVAAGAWRAGC